MKQRILALLLMAAVGCGGSSIPVASGGKARIHDHTNPPSVAPPGFVPSFHLSGSVDIPAELKGVLNATFVPQRLIGDEGTAELQLSGRETKIVGGKLHFRASVEAKTFNAVTGLLPKNGTLQIEGANARGERARITVKPEFRSRLTTRGYSDDDYWDVWGEDK